MGSGEGGSVVLHAERDALYDVLLYQDHGTYIRILLFLLRALMLIGVSFFFDIRIDPQAIHLHRQPRGAYRDGAVQMPRRGTGGVAGGGCVGAEDAAVAHALYAGTVPIHLLPLSSSH